MKVKVRICSVLLTFIFLSCNSEKTITTECVEKRNDELSYGDKEKIARYGDFEKYENFKLERFFKSPETVIFYSLVMAHKHNNPEAYYDVYLFTSQAMKNSGIHWEDSSMRKFTLPYLYKSAELGYHQAQSSVSHIENKMDSLK